MSKIGDMLVSIYDSMSRKLKIIIVVSWIYLGLRFLLRDIGWLLNKF